MRELKNIIILMNNSIDRRILFRVLTDILTGVKTVFLAVFDAKMV